MYDEKYHIDMIEMNEREYQSIDLISPAPPTHMHLTANCGKGG